LTAINITSAGRALVRLSFEDSDGELAFESNLTPAAAAEVIAIAMEKLAMHSGAEEQARTEAAAARASDPTAGEVARAMARMVAEMFAAMPVPEIDVDIGDWSVPGQN
jgi:uncharacterized membrane protein